MFSSKAKQAPERGACQRDTGVLTLTARSELSQARARVALTVVWLAFSTVALSVPTPGSAMAPLHGVLLGLCGYLLFGLLWWAWVARDARRPPWRRHMAIVLDVVAISFCFAAGGVVGVVTYPVYLWVIMGNGFRFGIVMARFAFFASLLGFLAALLASPFWRTEIVTGLGLFAGLVALSLFYLDLFSKLERALMASRDADQAKVRFLAGMSHELRTPISAIVGTTQLLQRTGLSAHQASLTRNVAHAAQVLLDLISNVFDFSHAASRPVGERADQTTALAPVVTDSVRLLADGAREKGLTLHLFYDPLTPPVVRAAAPQVRQVLFNLIGNAIKFTERGGVWVVVEPQGVAGDKVRVRVRDTGIGIAPEHRPRVFEAFYRADDAVVRTRGGAGLGAAIARQVVHGLGGTIAVDSDLGRGSEFRFTLPAEPAGTSDSPARAGLHYCWAGKTPVWHADYDNALQTMGMERRPRHVDVILYACDNGLETRAKTWASSDSSNLERVIHVWVCPPATEYGSTVDLAMAGFNSRLPAPGDHARLAEAIRTWQVLCGDPPQRAPMLDRPAKRMLRILVVDDESVNRAVTERFLAARGHHVTTAQGGREAVARLSSDTFDAAVLDYHMPEMDGLEVARHCRRRGIASVVLSADVTDTARKAFEDSDADAWLTKPAAQATLCETVENVASGEQPADAPAPPESTRVLDGGRLEALAGKRRDIKVVKDLFAQLEAQTRAEIDDLRRQLTDGEFGQLRQISHRIAGAAGALGARMLARAARELCAANDDDLRRQGEEWISDLEQKLRLTLDAVNTHVNSGTPPMQAKV